MYRAVSHGRTTYGKTCERHEDIGERGRMKNSRGVFHETVGPTERSDLNLFTFVPFLRGRFLRAAMNPTALLISSSLTNHLHTPFAATPARRVHPPAAAQEHRATLCPRKFAVTKFIDSSFLLVIGTRQPRPPTIPDAVSRRNCRFHCENYTRVRVRERGERNESFFSSFFFCLPKQLRFSDR